MVFFSNEMPCLGYAKDMPEIRAMKLLAEERVWTRTIPGTSLGVREKSLDIQTPFS
jgi:hypothetical protein